MKDLELRLLSELMKDSHRSDRQLAKVLGVSQPTVTRAMRKLKEGGYVKEYTIIPDFDKLGYQLMGITFVKQKDNLTQNEWSEVHKKTRELEKENPHAAIIAVNGIGLNKDIAFVTFYKDYSAYVRGMEIVKQVPYADLGQVETFLVNLKNPDHYRLLSMAALANHILTLRSEKT